MPNVTIWLPYTGVLELLLCSFLIGIHTYVDFFYYMLEENVLNGEIHTRKQNKPKQTSKNISQVSDNHGKIN